MTVNSGGLHAYAASLDLRKITPSMLGEAHLEGTDSNGHEVWVDQAVSTKTLNATQKIYTASCLDLPAHSGSLLISCYFMTPSKNRPGLLRTLDALFENFDLPPLNDNGSDFEKYDSWMLPSGRLRKFLSADFTETQTGETLLQLSDHDRPFPVKSLAYGSEDLTFRLTYFDDCLIGQVVEGPPTAQAPTIYQLSDSDFRAVQAKKRQE